MSKIWWVVARGDLEVERDAKARWTARVRGREEVVSKVVSCCSVLLHVSPNFKLKGEEQKG